MNRAEMGASLNLSEDLIPPHRPNRNQRAITTTSITLHNTGNTDRGADAAQHSKFVTRNGRYRLRSGRNQFVSWHFTVDDVEVIKQLPIDEAGIHAGRAANRSSIAIETCMHDGIDQDAAEDRLARLVAVLRYDLGFDRDQVKSHYDWTGKNCPVLMLPRWGAFMDRIDDYLADLYAAEAGALDGTPQGTWSVSEEEPSDPEDVDHSAIAQAVNAMSGGHVSRASVIPSPLGERETAVSAPADLETLDLSEPDDGFNASSHNILAYPSAASVMEIVQAEAFSTFQNYKSDFADSIADLNLKYFEPHEFLFLGGKHGNPQSACYGKNALPPRSLWPNVRALAVALDEIRHRLGAPIRLSSVYRNAAYNSCIDGASQSLHKRFKAADFSCATGSPTRWHRVAKEVRSEGIYRGGLKRYSTFVHVDVRGTNVDF